MALDLQGKPTEAFVALEELLNMPGHTELSAEQVAAATQRHTVLKTIPASIVVQVVSATAPGPEKPAQPLSDVQLTVNGAEQAGLPPFTLKLPAGEHNLAVTAPGYEPQSLTVTVRPAESVEETFLLDPVAQPAAVAPAAPPEVEDTAPSVPLASNRTPGFVTLGVAGAAAVVGTVFGVQALGAKDKFEDDPTVAHADDVERNALIADMAFGIAFTLGITGVVLLLADEPPTQSATSTSTDTALRVVPFFSRESGGAAAHLTF